MPPRGLPMEAAGREGGGRDCGQQSFRETCRLGSREVGCYVEDPVGSERVGRLR